jgi:hypothetical protein
MKTPIERLKEEIEEFRTMYNDEATIEALLYALRALEKHIKEFDPDNTLPPASSWSGPLAKFIGPMASFYYGGRK